MGLKSVRVPWGSACMDPIKSPSWGPSDMAGRMLPWGAECQLLQTVLFGLLRAHTYPQRQHQENLSLRVPFKQSIPWWRRWHRQGTRGAAAHPFWFSWNHRVVCVWKDFRPFSCDGESWHDQIRLPRAPSNLALSISRNGASTTILGSLTALLS